MRRAVSKIELVELLAPRAVAGPTTSIWLAALTRDHGTGDPVDAPCLYITI